VVKSFGFQITCDHPTLLISFGFQFSPLAIPAILAIPLIVNN
jgi:hypothetical protein